MGVLAHKNGSVGRSRLVLEIMPHCVALPWDAKTGSPRAGGAVQVAGGRGSLR